MRKKVLFITGTRADFGKLKPLITAVRDHQDFDYQIFGTGMHMLAKYGNTISEIKRAGFDNLFMFINQMEGDLMEVVLANTVTGLTRFLQENEVDLIVIHGDRIEALAGAIVGALRNTLVAHVEGGEVSGTIDDLLRHATSKLSHIHFVASSDAEKRLIQLGENATSVFRIGSPDVDIMLSKDLPSFEETLQRYTIPFKNYGIAMLHPVTTEFDNQYYNSLIFVDSLIESGGNFILIYPNNDHGSVEVFKAYEKLKGNNKIAIFPSIRFEYFLTLLKESEFIIGNSSTGIHEAPVYGVPTINIGTRQMNRLSYDSIFNVTFDKTEILEAIKRAKDCQRFKPCSHYGDGRSAERFIQTLASDKLWKISKQKLFRDIQY